MSDQVTISVLVCDDEALVRKGLTMILEAEADIEVVATAGNGLEAVEEVLRARPNVVLMDIRMPVLDGIEATRRLVSDARVSARVVVLTTFNEDEHVFAALRAGASGFLLKSSPPAELVLAVRAAARGDVLLAPEVTRRLVEDLLREQAAAPTTYRDLTALTTREIEVLTLIGRGLTNAEIAAELYLSEATVKTHINRLFTKLDIRDRARAVIAAYEAGLVRPGG